MTRALIVGSIISIALVGCSVDTSGTGDLTVEPIDTGHADTTIGAGDSSLVEDTNAPDTLVAIDSALPDTEVIDTAVPDTEPVDACPTTCPSLSTCVGGACTCPVNSRLCSVGCVDEKADPNRCGSCDVGLPCAEGSMCANGVCACQPGLALCGGVCVDMKGHAAACGACAACGSNMRCVNGMCMAAESTTCPPSRPDECATSDGRKSCFDTKIDPMHCGGCAIDKRCTSSELCINGSCKKYAVGVGCTTCPCATCDLILKGSRCCPAPAGSAPDRVFCVNAGACPAYLP